VEAGEPSPCHDFAEVAEKSKALDKLGGLFYMAVCLDHEAAERIAHDMAVDGKGFDILVGGAFREGIRTHYWREKYIGRLPVLVDGGHGARRDAGIPFYARTLFVAKSRKYEDFLDAVRQNRIVTVVYHDRSVYYGRPEWIQYVKDHAGEWRPRWSYSPLKNGRPHFPDPRR